jgi:selenium metabolism protein YedF
MAGKTFLVQSEFLGHGDDELGMLLMSKFLGTLSDGKDKPARMVFLNSGVKLVAEGSWALGHLKKLESQGVEMLSCGTCLDFFELTDKIKVGKPTTMVDAVAFMLQTDTVCL